MIDDAFVPLHKPEAQRKASRLMYPAILSEMPICGYTQRALIDPKTLQPFCLPRLAMEGCCSHVQGARPGWIAIQSSSKNVFSILKLLYQMEEPWAHCEALLRSKRFKLAHWQTGGASPPCSPPGYPLHTTKSETKIDST